MRSSSKRGTEMTTHQVLASACWFFVFAGFIIYQTVVQRGYLSPIFGGFFTFSILASLVVLLPAWLKNSLKKWTSYLRHDIPAHAVIPILFWAYMLIFGVNLAFGLYLGVSAEIIYPLIAYFIKFIGLYVLTTSVPLTHEDFLRWNRVVFVSLALLVVLNSSDGSYLIHLVSSLEQEQQLDYHGLALSFSLVALLGIYGVRSLVIRWGLWGIALVALFLIGARSEFAGFFIAAAVIEVLKASSVIGKVRLVSGALIALLTMRYFFDKIMIIDSRVLGLIDLKQDESAIERNAVARAAWNAVRENPILGKLASYEPGEYAHNILSAWVDLGLLGFLLLSSILVLQIAFLAHRALKCRRSSIEMAFGLAVMCLVLVFYAKTYFYQLIPITTGVVVGYSCIRATRANRVFLCKATSGAGRLLPQ